MTPQELKNSILQRAIEGKLVEQRKEEGTGAELFEKIQKEKKKLVEEGRIKKQKALPQITEEEIPFDIPENWKWVRLGDVFRFINGDRGKNYPAKSKLKETGKIPFISAINLKDGTVDKKDLLYLDLIQYEKLGSGKLLKNDIVLCIRGSLGKCCIYPFEKGAIASSLVILRNYKDINLLFLLSYLNSYLFFSETRKYDNGTAQPNLSALNAKKILLPLPPLAEQKRIVEKIEELMPLVEEYEKNWQKLEELNKKFPEDMKKSLLQEAIKGKLVEQRKEEGTGAELFEKIQKEKKKPVGEGKLKKQKALDEIKEEEIPFDIPENWKWVRLGEISDYNNVKTKIKPNEIPPDTWTLDLEDIEKDTGFILKMKFARDKIIKGERTIFHRDQILYSKLRPYLKKILVAPDSGVCSSELVPFSCFSDINSEFLVYLLKSPYTDRTINLATYGVKMPRVGTETMIHLLLPLPPLAEQKRIVEKLDEMLPYCDELLKII